MLIDQDLKEFFNSMLKLEIKMRDFYGELSLKVDDPEIRGLMRHVSEEEQTHVECVQRMIELVTPAS
jgi:rubrerythrin